ncbi:MAG: TonB-dependent receptor [Candidatus Marinimicrobia bacterium]|nr:TonB-dependent receptor [Candidatus Neomarinimicrobiota bacterium]
MIKENNFLFRLKGIFIFIFIFNINYAQPDNVVVARGKVLDSITENPISNANVYSDDMGTVTDEQGEFLLRVPKNSEITISVIGYDIKTILASDSYITIYLEKVVIKGEEVVILANRAIAGVTPVAFSTLTQEEISIYYTVEDVPMILATEPGVYAYSESGNGTGYSYISIRGFDQSRISVMLDNVPLNDNESHQVYWVDHGDILSDAKDVQIQRGIGNSLYGSAAFGGSINILTQIASSKQELSATATAGSFNTTKYRLKFNSGTTFGENLSLTARMTQIQSDGYRDFHKSLQRSLFIGVEHHRNNMTNQLRATIGYENTGLLWDGIAASDINDRKKRRIGYKSYTDDFLQQIYSLNTFYRFSDDVTFHNVAYMVRGSGYYEVFKYDRDLYSYSLDMDDVYSDSMELEMETDLLRRKWIVNQYYGIVPTVTWSKDRFRLDFGGEIRFYTGDHFGEVTDFSNEALAEKFGNNWYKYYKYIGTKQTVSGFVHLVYSLTSRLKLIGDILYQGHRWNLDQKKIGHAAGHQLSADWDFLNPRFGLIYGITDNLSFFGNYGQAQKEPSDDQIIEADDVWSEPVMAAAEVIDNFELGANYFSGKITADLNVYRINYDNEQLKNIDVEQEGEYNYFSADGTVHEGLEFELKYKVSPQLKLGVNGTLYRNLFKNGIYNGNSLPNVPQQLFNASVQYRLMENLNIFSNLRMVGRQYIDNENTEEGVIESFSVVNLGMKYGIGPIVLNVKVNNVFDTLYSTFGYGYEWDGYWAYYWPGATRNYYVTLTYSL